ncbi:hypothetical protein GYMLUDRAFT_221162 [Collybiopsis luxurians FD-317 M1]|uniref:RING-type domain-containing protein n=1 Tax=Collybiopsis luxurians FD-317 M1 TaxID=944289 RepID=A0A0D0D3X4_9AGAR|nr:hypothetical protein GYMLUDRAFT_221162 [Collybiopsis luxurians FD-317 M1]
MEGSIIEGSVPTTGSASTPNTTLGDESFNRAIEVLRQDGLSELRSQQFINRHRQRRDAAPTTTSAWGDIESNPNPYPFTYRFPSWHSRANELNNGSGSLSTANNSTATSRMGNTATRRRPSPGRSSDILSDARPGRPRPNRLGRHRPELSLGDSFVTLSDLVNRTRRPPRGNFNLGDYIRDEDFDQSYEGLVSLAATLGEVKPRSTPDHVVAGLKTGFYKDWATESSDKRCPICLDDYKALDPVLKLNDCSHWLHKSCLEQWLKGANTCPVCRNPVQGAASQRHLRVRSQLYRSNTSRSGGSHLHSTNSSEGSFDNTSTTVNSFSSIPAQASNQSTDPSSNSDSGPTSDIDSSSVNTFTARGGFRNFRRFY